MATAIMATMEMAIRATISANAPSGSMSGESRSKVPKGVGAFVMY
jgi:hypothetical protein